VVVTISILVGGADGDVAGVLPYLRAMGRIVRHMGPIGAGSLAKACNQLVVAGTLAALAEAVLLGETGGLDRRTLLEVLAGGLAASEVLEQKREHLVSGDFHGSGPVGFLVKDLGFVHDSAAAQHVTLPVTEAAARLYTAAVARGQGDLDNSVVLDVLRHPSSGPVPHPTRETFLTADPR
jgi:2-hydroxy-3-oxopropionate reductase